MFSKKKKKPQISAPANFEHRVHTGFDKREGKYVGLPLQWASIVGNNQILKSSNRPLPLVDPSDITPIEINDLKTIVRPHHPGMAIREGSMTPQPLPQHQMQPTNGLVLPKTSAVARSNSLRSSSPPRIRRDLRGAMANVPPAVPEEGTPTPVQMMPPTTMNHHQTHTQPGMRPQMGMMGPAVPNKMNKPQPPLPGTHTVDAANHTLPNNAGGAAPWDRNHNANFTNGNGQLQPPNMPPQMPINVQTDVANNNYLRQQVSPGSGIVRQNNNNNNSPRMAAQPNPQSQLPPHQVTNNQHLINMQQQQKQQQQPHLLTHPYNNSNAQLMKPNSRASSSSGGNLSTTAPSIIGGGGVGGGLVTASAHLAPSQSGGPSPTNTAGGGNNKAEQRLTHEEFRKALQMVVSGGDPRENLQNFMKIGEGSTGTVCIATDQTTGEWMDGSFVYLFVCLFTAGNRDYLDYLSISVCVHMKGIVTVLVSLAFPFVHAFV